MSAPGTTPAARSARRPAAQSLLAALLVTLTTLGSVSPAAAASHRAGHQHRHGHHHGARHGAHHGHGARHAHQPGAPVHHEVLPPHTARRAVRYAAAQAGKPYVYGAEGPRAFDCSGLTSWVFNVKLDEHLPRTSDAQYRATRHIDKSRVRPGDLVFFFAHGHVYHVGIYAGRHRIWHAPYPGARVRLEHLWTTRWHAGRVRT